MNAAASNPNAQRCILTVDDSPSMRDMISFTVESAGYRVIVAVDGIDALEKARANAFDLILTDQNMPRMDGLTLVRELRAMPAYAHTPILLVTTEGGDEIKAQGRAVKASGWIVKPFSPQMLLDLIARLFR